MGRAAVHCCGNSISVGCGMSRRPKIPRPVTNAAAAVAGRCEQGLLLIRPCLKDCCIPAVTEPTTSLSFSSAEGMRYTVRSMYYARGEVARRALLSSRKRSPGSQKISVMHRRNFEQRPSRLSRVSVATDL